MAPSKKASTPNAQASQRTIASFFGSKGPVSTATAHSPCSDPKKPKLYIGPTDTLEAVPSTPSLRGDSGSSAVPSPTVKRRRLRKVCAKEESETLASNSPDLTILKKPDAVAKGMEGLSTPSPSEAASKHKQGRSSDKITRDCRSKIGTEQCDKENLDCLIGKRLKVYWPLDDAWYPGHVKSFNKVLSTHVILYEDGQEESIWLDKEKIKWLEESKDSYDASTIVSNRSSIAGVSSKGRRKLDTKFSKTNDEVEVDDRYGRRKRARLQVVPEDESPCKHLVANSHSENEPPVPQPEVEEEFKRRKRLTKKGSPSAHRLDLVDDVGGNEVVTSTPGSSPDSGIVSSPSDKVPLRNFFTKSETNPGKGVSNTNKAGLKFSCLSRNEQIFTPKDKKKDNAVNSHWHATLVGEAAERFGARAEEKFKFLGKGCKDASGRRPTDSNYDFRTLYLPPDFLKGLSGGQRQWWEFKSKHMDKVLLFKMGKFYEMFEMDAHVGAQELDLQYMKGEQPHCGFPEKNYSENAEKLARKGYRVLVVEQTETPEQLDQRKRETGAKDKVVKREVCAVITKGTMVDGEMLAANPDASYLLSITEMPSPNCLDASPTIGICVVDTSTSQFMLGQFEDDSARTRLCLVLTELRPVEIVKPRGLLSEATERALRIHTRKPLVNDLMPGTEFWDAEQALKEIVGIYLRGNVENFNSQSRKMDNNLVKVNLHLLPDILQQVAGSGIRGKAALSAMGGCVFYLRQALLDQTMLAPKLVHLLPLSDSFSSFESDRSMLESNIEKESLASTLAGRVACGVGLCEPFLVLDSAALENLEILENNRDGGSSGTLLAHLDNCVTAYGRRLLRQWLVRPLLRPESILNRQVAISDLKGVAADSAVGFRKALSGQPDMERLLFRLHAGGGACGRNSQKVVLYEDAAKKKLQEFMSAIRGCRSLLHAVTSFQSCLSDLKSIHLQNLVSVGDREPNMNSVIDHFEKGFDWLEAERTGRIVPRDGVDKEFDSADNSVCNVEAMLTEYLEKQRQRFGKSAEISYVTVGKEAYQMEIPEHLQAKVPSNYEVRSSRKGFTRYWTPDIKDYLQDLAAAEQQREQALKGILQGLVKRFCEEHGRWLSLVKVIAELDALISLAEAGAQTSPSCQPTFVCQELETETPRIVAKGLKHPMLAISLAGGRSLVPNDVVLGGRNSPFMLLSGPNMGGKSTLLRQVCLAVVLAQVGANVPAEHFQLSPVDRVCVRMGARDQIMAGQSTFLVELLETASMLRLSTRHSLVALDELGRGTATSDGQAIAHAVLQHLAHTTGCRGLFSTHYHRLATDFSTDSRVALYHMACKVGKKTDGVEEVTFLYKLAMGACPKSYGVNVARLAGIPDPVLRRAAERSSQLETVRGTVSSLPMHQDLTKDSKAAELCTKILNLLQDLPSTGDKIGALPLLSNWKTAQYTLQQQITV